MVASTKISVSKESLMYFNLEDKRIGRGASKGMKKAGAFVHDEVLQSIAGNRAEHESVDTGDFLRSVDVQVSGDLEIQVSAGVEYGLFLEHGTSKMAGRHHFGNTAARVMPDVKEIVSGEVRKAR